MTNEFVIPISVNEWITFWNIDLLIVSILFLFSSFFKEVVKKTNEFLNAGRNTVRLGGAVEGEQSVDEAKEAQEKEKPRTREIKWRHGDMEFEAYMRMLDNSVR